MAAAKGNKNAAGNRGGATLNDKLLAAEVRNMALNEIKEILQLPRMTQLKQQVILRLAGTVLPRLNEHSGEGGEPIHVLWQQSPSLISPASGPNISTTARVVG